MKKRTIALCCVMAVLLAGNILQFALNNTSRLLVVAVPDEETALKIAEAVLLSTYGDDVLSEKPFIAAFDESKKAWIVTGSLPDGYVGGVPEIVIRKSDAKILKIHHGM